MSRAGNFEIDVWVGGWPVWCELTYEGQRLKFTDTELSDLIYAARKARAQANAVRENFKRPPLSEL